LFAIAVFQTVISNDIKPLLHLFLDICLVQWTYVITLCPLCAISSQKPLKIYLLFFKFCIDVSYAQEM